MAVAISTMFGAHSPRSLRTSRKAPMASYSWPIGTTSSTASFNEATRAGRPVSASSISQRSAPSAAAVRCATSSSAAGRSVVDARVWVTASSISARSTCSRSSAKRSAAWIDGPPAAATSRMAARWLAVKGRRRRKAARRPIRMPPATSGTASTERMDSSPSHARPAAGEAGTAASAGGRRVVSHSARRPKGRWASVRAVEPRAKPSAVCRSSSLPSRPSSQMAAASADTRAFASAARRRTTSSRSRRSGPMPPPRL